MGRSPLTLDGGLGTLLESHGHDLSSSLWSARLLLDDPDAIRAAHAEYFAAGARVAITSSYQVSYEGMDAAGYRRDEVDALLTRSVRLARDARVDAGLTENEAWVAASVGPFGASRADGSEYTGAYGLDVARLREWHRPRLRALADAGPDVIAVETVPASAEVEALCLELSGLGVPAWISVTVAGAALRSGESLAEAFALADAVDEVVAIGVNCCDVDEVSVALDVLRCVSAKPAVVYPNSGEQWHAKGRRWSGTASAISESTPEWIARGARLVGGCCRVGVDEVAGIAEAVAKRRVGSVSTSAALGIGDPA